VSGRRRTFWRFSGVEMNGQIETLVADAVDRELARAISSRCE
jgi:hypothetical protein